MAERHVSIPKPFSTGDITEWFQRFEICCRANGWNNEAKAVKLPTLLEGEAIAVWLELSEEEQACRVQNREETFMQEITAAGWNSFRLTTSIKGNTDKENHCQLFFTSLRSS